MPRVYVSIGSNIDRAHHIHGAVRRLREHFGLLTLSRVYETTAEGFDGDAFYNLVAGFDTDEPLARVRQTLTDMETEHGRKRGDSRFGPRTLDLDILLYGDLVRHDDGFDIPRGEIKKYAFVLGPLTELAPDLKHPETGERLLAMWTNFTGRRDLRQVTLTLD